jgi:hypothetical protein
MIFRTLLLIVLLQASASAQQPGHLPDGTELLLILPEDTPVHGSVEGIGDMIIVTGRTVGVVAPGSCGEFPVYVQSATIVDPGHSRGTRISNEFMVTVVRLESGEDAVQALAAGTRLGRLDPLGPCTGPGGKLFNLFRAFIE